MNNSIKIQTSLALPTKSIQKKIDVFHLRKNKLTSLPPGQLPDDLHQKILKVLNHAAETYSFFGVESEIEKIPRDATMVCGPSYVSEQHPQPLDSTGRPMFPVLQADLDWVGLVTGRRFKRQILQLWWSSFDVRGELVIIPKEYVDLSMAKAVLLPDDVLYEALNWIPFDWTPGNRGTAYLISGCKSVGITFPSFAWVLDDYETSEVHPDIWDLICEVSEDYPFNTRPRGSNKFIFQLFGRFKTHSCSPWDLGSEMCFLHTPQWSQGMMDANIFMESNVDGVIDGFDFGFGR